MTHSMSHGSVEDYFRIPELYKRAAWAARKPKSTVKSNTPVIYLVFKKTETEECHNMEECMDIIREIQRKDMDEDGLPDIQYNFLIGTDGSMYEGRGWDTAPEPFPINKKDFVKELHTKALLIGLITDDEEKRHQRKQEMSVLHLVGIGSTDKKIEENAQFLNYDEVSKKGDKYDWA